VTGYNFLLAEVGTKRLELMHGLVPKAVRFAMLVNPENVPITSRTLREVPEAARAIGLQLQILNASTKDEIEAAFDTLVRDRIDALFVAPDPFFISQRDQFATLTARYRIPAAYSTRDDVEAGGLMSYGTDNQEAYRQVGIYTVQILKGAKPADLSSSTVNQVLVSHQPENGEGSWHRGAQLNPIARRRGDRMRRREFIVVSTVCPLLPGAIQRRRRITWCAGDSRPCSQQARTRIRYSRSVARYWFDLDARWLP